MKIPADKTPKSRSEEILNANNSEIQSLLSSILNPFATLMANMLDNQNLNATAEEHTTSDTEKNLLATGNNPADSTIFSSNNQMVLEENLLFGQHKQPAADNPDLFTQTVLSQQTLLEKHNQLNQLSKEQATSFDTENSQNNFAFTQLNQLAVTKPVDVQKASNTDLVDKVTENRKSLFDLAKPEMNEIISNHLLKNNKIVNKHENLNTDQSFLYDAASYSSKINLQQISTNTPDLPGDLSQYVKKDSPSPKFTEINLDFSNIKSYKDATYTIQFEGARSTSGQVKIDIVHHSEPNQFDNSYNLLVKIHPPELGQVMAKIHTEQGISKLFLLAENIGVQQALQSNLEQLQIQLRHSGITVSQIEVSLGSFSNQFTDLSSSYRDSHPKEAHQPDSVKEQNHADKKQNKSIESTIDTYA